MKYSSRFFLYAPFSLFVALALGVAIHWWFAATAFSRWLDALNGREALPGVTIGFASKTISGFPFRLDALFTDLQIKGAGANGPVLWKSERFALHSLTYNRDQDIFEAAGNQILGWTDVAKKNHLIHFLPGSMRASVITDRRGLSHFDLDIIGASGTDSAGKTFTVERAQAHLRRDPDGAALDLMVSGDEVKDAGVIAPLFGNRIHRLRLYAKFTQAAVFAPLLAGNASWPDAAANWRRSGGSVAIGPVDVDSAGLILKSDANAGGGLDALLSPLY